MLLDSFRAKSKLLVKIWLFIFIFQASFVIISAIVVKVLSPSSNYWVLEYLTLVHKMDQKIKAVSFVWLIVNSVVTLIDFWFSYSVHNEIFVALKKTYSNREAIIINEMKKRLNMVLVGMLIALFMQLVNGVLWWMVGSIVVAIKYFFFKNLTYLVPYDIISSETDED